MLPLVNIGFYSSAWILSTRARALQIHIDLASKVVCNRFQSLLQSLTSVLPIGSNNKLCLADLQGRNSYNSLQNLNFFWKYSENNICGMLLILHDDISYAHTFDDRFRCRFFQSVHIAIDHSNFNWMQLSPDHSIVKLWKWNAGVHVTTIWKSWLPRGGCLGCQGVLKIGVVQDLFYLLKLSLW